MTAGCSGKVLLQGMCGGKRVTRALSLVTWLARAVSSKARGARQVLLLMPREGMLRSLSSKHSRPSSTGSRGDLQASNAGRQLAAPKAGLPELHSQHHSSLKSSSW